MIDLSPLLNIGLEFLGVIILALGSWAIAKFTKKIGLDQDKEIRSYLESALAFAVQYGKGKVKGKDVTIETENETLAHAVNYVVAQVPGALTHFKINTDSLERLIRARLDPTPEIANVMNVTNLNVPTAEVTASGTEVTTSGVKPS